MARPQKLTKAPPKPRRPTVAPKCLPIRKFAELHGIHETTVWRALRDGRLKAIRVGKRPLVLLDSVQGAEAEA
jgi:excisionase family DNA binding protein